MNLHLDPKKIVHSEFGCLEPVDPAWQEQHEYWEDFNARFFRSNGLAYVPARHSNVSTWLQTADRAPFSSMLDALLPQLQARADLSDVDLVLVAHWMPDLHLGTSVTNYALHKLDLDDGFGFAISDRGLSAPLYALHCAERYLRHGRRKALLIVMDQKHLLYRSTVVDRLNPSNTASLMVLEVNATSGFIYGGYERRTGVKSSEVPDAVAQICQAHRLKQSEVLVVADPEVAASLNKFGPVQQQQPQKLCSAPFACLAESEGPERDTILLTCQEGELAAVLFRAQREG